MKRARGGKGEVKAKGGGATSSDVEGAISKIGEKRSTAASLEC
jgi:hypothetical protein